MCVCVCVWLKNAWFNSCSQANLTLRQSSTKLLFWFSKPQVSYMCILCVSVGGSFFSSLPLIHNVFDSIYSLKGSKQLIENLIYIKVKSGKQIPVLP